MAAADVFVFKNSGLNAFLFAEVGTELNGSPLTILVGARSAGAGPLGRGRELGEVAEGRDH